MLPALMSTKAAETLIELLHGQALVSSNSCPCSLGSCSIPSAKPQTCNTFQMHMSIVGTCGHHAVLSSYPHCSSMQASPAALAAVQALTGSSGGISHIPHLLPLQVELSTIGDLPRQPVGGASEIYHATCHQLCRMLLGA